MKVWIDPDLCTGDGICVEICPKVFFMHDDGLAYVKEVDDKTGLVNGTPKHISVAGRVDFPDDLLDDVIEAAEECPGECIFIESD